MSAVTSYAAMKGRAAQAKQAVAPRPPAPISEEEAERIRRDIALVKAHMPELVPFIKELHEAGLIDGWRAVQNVQAFSKNGKEP